MLGRGKYDKECTEARNATLARSALLIVIGGQSGNGFSALMHPFDIGMIPALLRGMADEIERSGPFHA